MEALQIALDRYISSCRAKLFDWRLFNCMHYAGGWVELREQRVLALPRSLREGIALRDEKGGVAGAVTFVLGRDPLPMPTLAGIGDIVLFPTAATSDRAYLGLCCGRRSALIAQGESSIVFVLTDEARVAWRVEGGGA